MHDKSGAQGNNSPQGALPSYRVVQARRAKGPPSGMDTKLGGAGTLAAFAWASALRGPAGQL